MYSAEKARWILCLSMLHYKIVGTHLNCSFEMYFIAL